MVIPEPKPAIREMMPIAFHCVGFFNIFPQFKSKGGIEKPCEFQISQIRLFTMLRGAWYLLHDEF
jgi:hypothetical protein